MIRHLTHDVGRVVQVLLGLVFGLNAADELLQQSLARDDAVRAGRQLFRFRGCQKKNCYQYFSGETLRSKNRKTKRMIKQPIEVQVAVSEHNSTAQI